MRSALVAVAISLAACSPVPTPSAPPPSAVSSPSISAGPTATGVSPAPTITFNFDVENHSSVGVVVSVSSDTAAALAGFEPGQRGTMWITLGNPQNGIGVEIQGSECRLLASGHFPTPGAFTLLLENGAQAETIEVDTRAGASETPLPLPSNALVGCGG